jgi:tetratricopeptide (TPR) repeat protein
MYKALSPMHQTMPFKMPKIHRSVYSFEGLCYVSYYNIEVFYEVIRHKAYLKWMDEALGLTHLTKQIRDMEVIGMAMKSIMLGILRLCPPIADLGLKDFEERFDAYTQEPEHIHLKKKGDLAFNKKEYIKALHWYRDAQKCRYDPLVENNIGVVQMALNNFDSALKCFYKALKDVEDINVGLNIVKCHCILETYDQAIVMLNKIQPLFESPLVWYYYGIVYSGLEQYEEALTAYVRAYEVSGELYMLEALMHMEIRIGNYDQVARRLKQLKLDEPIRHYVEAQLEKAQQMWSDYILSMEKAIHYSDYELKYLMELLIYYRNNSQLIKAIELFHQVKPEDQGRDEVVYQLAFIDKLAGNKDAYRKGIDHLMNQWKKEVRRNVTY